MKELKGAGMGEGTMGGGRGAGGGEERAVVFTEQSTIFIQKWLQQLDSPQYGL